MKLTVECLQARFQDHNSRVCNMSVDKHSGQRLRRSSVSRSEPSCQRLAGVSDGKISRPILLSRSDFEADEHFTRPGVGYVRGGPAVYLPEVLERFSGQEICQAERVENRG